MKASRVYPWACPSMISSYADTQTHACTRARTSEHTHTHTHTPCRNHAAARRAGRGGSLGPASHSTLGREGQGERERGVGGVGGGSSPGSLTPGEPRVPPDTQDSDSLVFAGTHLYPESGAGAGPRARPRAGRRCRVLPLMLCTVLAYPRPAVPAVRHSQLRRRLMAHAPAAPTG